MISVLKASDSKNQICGWVFSSIIAMVLVVMGYNLVLQRGRELALSIDNTIYLSMIDNGIMSVGAPFRYRIIVPLIASYLPASSVDALKYISLTSLIICYYLMLLICRRMGFGRWGSALGLMMAYGTVSHILNYQNLIMTDAFQLLILTLAIYFVVINNYCGFLVIAGIGVLSRETCIFIAPVWWLVRGRRQGAIAICLGLLAFIFPRLIMGGVENVQGTSLLDALGNAYYQHANVSIMNIIKRAFVSYGHVWLMAVFGLIAMRKYSVYYHQLYSFFICLTVGALATSFIADDIERMWMILFPVLVIASSAFFKYIFENMAEWYDKVCVICLMTLLLPLIILQSDTILMSGSVRQAWAGCRISVMFMMLALTILLILRSTRVNVRSL